MGPPCLGCVAAPVASRRAAPAPAPPRRARPRCPYPAATARRRTRPHFQKFSRYYRTTGRSVRVRSGASLSSAPLCDIPAGVVVRVDAIKLDGGRERARVAEPGAYEGWCSLSERLLTFVGSARPEGMARGSGDPRPDPSPFYEIRDSGSAAVDGRYERHHLRGYRGAAAYKKVGSAMTLYRWRQKMWILADLGPGLSKFGEPHAWYTAPCGSPPEATPVTSAKWARACADGDLPPFVEVRGPVIQVEESGSDEADKPIDDDEKGDVDDKGNEDDEGEQKGNPKAEDEGDSPSKHKRRWSFDGVTSKFSKHCAGKGMIQHASLKPAYFVRDSPPAVMQSIMACDRKAGVKNPNRSLGAQAADTNDARDQQLGRAVCKVALTRMRSRCRPFEAIVADASLVDKVLGSNTEFLP